jgi:putative membrane protein
MNTNGDPMMVSTGTVSTSGRSGMAGMNSRPVTMTPAMMDSKFAMDAAYSNNAEIAAGQMALRKSQDSEVRQYAQMMIDHHTAANTDLATAAQGMTLPAGLDPMHQALADGMEKLSGADFDMAYIKSQKAGHAMTRDMIDMYEDKGDNRNLKGYAKRTEPVVKQHHAVIMNIDARMHAMHMGGAAPRSQ